METISNNFPEIARKTIFAPGRGLVFLNDIRFLEKSDPPKVLSTLLTCQALLGSGAASG